MPRHWLTFRPVSIAARSELGAAAVQAGRRPPRRGRRALTADSPGGPCQAGSKALLPPSAGPARRRSARQPAQPPSQHRPAGHARHLESRSSKTTHGTGRGASNDRRLEHRLAVLVGPARLLPARRTRVWTVRVEHDRGSQRPGVKRKQETITVPERASINPPPAPVGYSGRPSVASSTAFSKAVARGSSGRGYSRSSSSRA